MERKKTLLFDFDGVIVDSFQLSYDSMRKISPEVIEVDAYRRFFDGNIYERTEVKEHLEGEDKTPDVSDPFFKHYTPALMDQPPVSGMVEMVKNLSKEYELVVVSSTINRPIEEYLKKHDLLQYFSKIYGADVHKSKLVKIKMVLEDYECTPERCVFVTDTLGDIREGTKAGVRSIGVSWGFQEATNLEIGDPIAVVDSVEELQRVIEEV